MIYTITGIFLKCHIRVRTNSCVLVLKPFINLLNFEVMRAIENVENKKQIKDFDPEKMKKWVILFFIGWPAIFVTIHFIETLGNINILKATGIL